MAERMQRGIQSIEVGGQLLRALAHCGRALPLKELAAEAGMSAAKAHPYLVSFGKLGLIAQDAASGHYGLGPLAMQLGLMSLQQMDPVALAMPLVEELAAATGHTVAVAVWGNRGATVVRIAQSPAAVHVGMRHGTVMSLRGTASGRLFAALLPAAVVQPVWRAEAALEGRRGPGLAAWQALLREVRAASMAEVRDLLVPGVSAVAAPVFDAGGSLVLVLTCVGTSAGLDTALGGPVATTLRQAAHGLSLRLGWRSTPPTPTGEGPD